MSEQIGVVLIDDHTLMRAGMRVLLESAGYVILGEASDGIEGLTLAQALQPHVVIIDIALPGADGVALTRELKRRHPGIGIIIFSMSDTEIAIRKCLKAGADAYCVKTSEPEILLEAMRLVVEGGAYFDPHIARLVLSSLSREVPIRIAEEAMLTSREVQIVAFIAEGCSNQAISQHMSLSLGTIKASVADILSKLNAADRAQAAVKAMRLGLLS
jgi:NarL family two-component system response regulator LiaR